MARLFIFSRWLAAKPSFFAAIVAAFRMIPFDDRYPDPIAAEVDRLLDEDARHARSSSRRASFAVRHRFISLRRL